MILEFDGIQFGFGERQLLSGIYVKCEKGKVTGLLGRNGTGKSTLLKIVFGALAVEISSVRIDKASIMFPAFRSAKIAYLPQDSFIPSDLTLRKILALYKIDTKKITDHFPELRDRLDFQSAELSGGSLRLFEVLLILNSNAPFCLLDEPFTGLSPALVERLQIVIALEKLRKGILITDHLYRQVMQLSDELYLLTDGKTYHIQNQEELVQRGYLMDYE
jgi:ABC-type branched-subunit amino acid transport system ATPase component